MRPVAARDVQRLAVVLEPRLDRSPASSGPQPRSRMQRKARQSVTDQDIQGRRRPSDVMVAEEHDEHDPPVCPTGRHRLTFTLFGV